MEAGCLNTAYKTWIIGIQVYFVIIVCSHMHSLFPLSLLQHCRQVIQNIQCHRLFLTWSAEDIPNWRDVPGEFQLAWQGTSAWRDCLVTASWSMNSPHWYSTKPREFWVQDESWTTFLITVSLCVSPAFGGMSITQQAFNLPGPLKLNTESINEGQPSRSWHCRMRSNHTSKGTKQSCFAGCLDFFDSKGIYGYLTRRTCLIYFEFYSDGRNLKLPLFLRGKGEQYYVNLLC